MSIILTDTNQFIYVYHTFPYNSPWELNLNSVTSYTDLTSTTILGNSYFNQTTQTNALTLINGPSAGTQRILKQILIHNSQSISPTNSGPEGEIEVVLTDTAGGYYKLFSSKMGPNQTVEWTEDFGWKLLSEDGSEISGITTAIEDIQMFTVAGKHVWQKPTTFNPKFARVLVWGAGGGGGGGGGATSGTRMGGSGGGGGAFNEAMFPISMLKDKEIVVVGKGGRGGTGGTAANGTNGQNGSESSFGELLYAFGGGGGSLGTNTSVARTGGSGGGRGGPGTQGTTAAIVGGIPCLNVTAVNETGGGGAPAGLPQGFSAQFGGGGGAGRTSSPLATGDAGNSIRGGGGGGQGACISSTPAYITGSAGGGNGAYIRGGGGAAGTSGTSPTAGENGYDGNANWGGFGGGGGGASFTASVPGATGGIGGHRGGGGGGGGAGGTGGGGAGGAGGDGEVLVICW